MDRAAPLCALLAGGLVATALLLGSWKSIERRRQGKVTFRAEHGVMGMKSCHQRRGKMRCRSFSFTDGIKQNERLLKENPHGVSRRLEKSIIHASTVLKNERTWGYVVVGVSILAILAFEVLGLFGFLGASDPDRRRRFGRLMLVGGGLLGIGLMVVATLFTGAIELPPGAGDKVSGGVGISYFLAVAGGGLALIGGILAVAVKGE